MKKSLLYRAVTVLLLLSMLLSVFVGCADEEITTNPNTDANPDTNTEETPKNVLTLADRKAAEFKIVYPLSASQKTLDLIDMIKETIENATGTNILAEHDSKPTAERELRIGYVKRTDALDVYKSFSDLGNNGYAIEHVGNHVYIYGKSDTALEAAVKHFVNGALTLDLANKTATVNEGLKIRYTDVENPNVEDVSSDGTYVSFLLNKGSLNETAVRVSFTGDCGWRIQSKGREQKAFDDIGASQRLSISLGEAPVLNVEAIGTKTENGKTTITAPDGSYAILNAKPFSIGFYTASDKEAACFTELSTNTDGSTVKGRMNAGEAIFGTGERFDSVNQRGKSIHMFTKDIWSRADACYMVVPLLCFSRGSGVFLNVYEEMYLDLGDASKVDKEDEWTARITAAEIDCYVYTSEQISDAIYGYSLLSGFAEMPEEWTYGMLVCRLSPDLSQKWSVDVVHRENQPGSKLGVYDVISKMEAYDLPWTGILAEGWGPYGSAKHEDLRELCDYVHALGKKMIVYIRVGTAHSGMDNYQRRYLVTMTLPDGTTTHLLPAAKTNNPDTNLDAVESHPYLDLTNPEAVEWFFNEYWVYLSQEIGVDGAKIDFCETLPEYYELNYYNENMPTEGSHHWYPTAFCSMFWDMISQKPDSGMCYSRGGGIGSQRSPYMWAGDQRRTHECLEFQLTAVLSSGLSGVPFMSYDMSGYQYGYAASDEQYKDPYYEGHVFVRGAQFSAFTICMQTHGKVRHAFQFADGQIAFEAVYKEDGTFSHWEDIKNPDGTYQYLIYPGEMTYITDIYRAYVKLHELLTPYITEYSEIACRTGMPVMRHLILQYQDDPNVYNIDDEYLFGDAFLVAPILDDSFERTIYLPAGSWRDLNDPETVYEGGQTITYQASLARLPVFYNEDAQTNRSTTAAELLDGIEEIFAYLAEVEKQIPEERFR